MEARANNDRHRQRQQKLKEQVDTRVAAATEKKGILIVFTGNGKGKSTAAFGTATRAVGHGKTVGIAQFIKGQWDNGEYNTLQPLGVEFHIMGTGFTWETQNRQADIEAATVVWQESKRMLADAHYDLVVLDACLPLSGYPGGYQRHRKSPCRSERYRHRTRMPHTVAGTGRYGQ